MLDISILYEDYCISQVRKIDSPDARHFDSNARSRIARSEPDKVDFDQRPLAKAIVDGPAQCASHCVPYGIVRASQSSRKLFESTLGGITQKRQGRIRGSLFDHTDQTDRGRCREATLSGDDQAGDRAAVEGNATAIF
jgi:hypothetical protein